MKIYIPSKGRPDRQSTLKSLPAALRKQVSLVVYNEEALRYTKWGIDLIVVPKSVKDIGTKRQFILENHDLKKYSRKMVMLDDDITFAKRRKDNPTLFTDCTEKDVVYLFDRIEELLSEFPHVGVVAREGANRRTENLLFNTRMMRVLGYNSKFLRERGIRFDRAAPMEDFDVHLQILRTGTRTVCINDFCQNQGSSNSAGGCSDYRDAHPEGAAAKLKKLHPDFVKIVEKTTKTAWGGGTRLDVNVRWKKAYEEGIKK